MNRLLVIVDLDGTLYDNSHRQHLIPADRKDTAAWSEFNCACEGDTIRPAVASLVETLLLSSAFVVFLTGRGEVAYEQTNRRLKTDIKGYIPEHLFMRSMGDYRAGWEFKLDAVSGIVERNPNYHVVALEDDPQIVEAFRKADITTLQIDSLCATRKD